MLRNTGTCLVLINVVKSNHDILFCLQLLLLLFLCVSLAVPAHTWMLIGGGLSKKHKEPEEGEGEFTAEDYHRMQELMPDMPTCKENCISDYKFCKMFGCLEKYPNKRQEWCMQTCRYITWSCVEECKEKGFVKPGPPGPAPKG